MPREEKGKEKEKNRGEWVVDVGDVGDVGDVDAFAQFILFVYRVGHFVSNNC